MFKSETISFHYFCPRIPKLNIFLDKKTVKQDFKSEHTDTMTDGRRDGRTFRLIKSNSPEGRCFENSIRETLNLSVCKDSRMDKTNLK